MKIKSDNKIIATGSSLGSLNVLDTPEKHESTEVACIASLQLWHERLTHVDKKGILIVIRHGVVKGIEV